LHRAAQKIGQGDLNFKVDVRTGDEIEQLADSFNNMAASLNEREEKIFEEKLYNEGIISSMIDTLIVVTPGGSIVNANKATCDLLGYAEEELVGQPVGMILAEEEEEEEEEEERIFSGRGLRKLVKDGSVRDMDLMYKAKSGEKIPVSFSGSVMYEKPSALGPQPSDEGETLRAESGEPEAEQKRMAGIVCVARDLRGLRELIHELECSKSKLGELARSLDGKVRERTAALASAQYGPGGLSASMGKHARPSEPLEQQVLPTPGPDEIRHRGGGGSPTLGDRAMPSQGPARRW